MPETKKYRVTEVLSFEGREFAVGEEIELGPAAAEEFAGKIEEIVPPVAGSSTSATSEENRDENAA